MPKRKEPKPRPCHICGKSTRRTDSTCHRCYKVGSSLALIWSNSKALNFFLEQIAARLDILPSAQAASDDVPNEDLSSKGGASVT